MAHRLPERARTAVAITSILLLLFASFGASLVRPDSALGAVVPQLKRYPYLTDLVHQSVTVNWSTDTSQTTGSVRYGISPNCSSNTAAASRQTISVGTVTQYQWKASLSGLSPDTLYCYRVYLGSTDLLATDPTPEFRSQVPAGSSAPFSFAVFGDWGAVDANGNNPDQANLMQQIANSGVRFAVTTGDTGYPGGTQLTYGDLYQKGADKSAIFGPEFWARAGDSIPLFNATGNHGFNSVGLTNWPQDQARATSGGRYQMDTYCCTNGTNAASYPSAWYAFDAGVARFYVLEAAWTDGNVGTADAYKNDYDNHWTPSSPQYQWLKHDLETHPGGLKFAFWHYPMYSDNATEDSSVFLQGPGSLEGLLAANGVSIGFNGHAHMYQRNLKPTGGIVTYLTGGGGAKVQPIGAHGCSALDAYGIGWSNSSNKGSRCGSAPVPTSRTQIFHFLKVTVAGSSVTVTPTDSLGRTFDVQTYTFGSSSDTEPPTTPGNLAASAPSATRVDLSWSAATDNVGVAGYEVYRDGTHIASIGTVTAYSDAAVSPSTTYAYAVRARDASGNASPFSNDAPVTTPPPSPTVAFSPTDDTYVQQAQPTQTAGSATTLQVDNSPVKDILLKFNVSGFAPQSITGAKLRLYVTDPSANGGDFFATQNASWTESTVTWNTAPATTGPPVASIGAVNAGAWYEVDLSSLVLGNGVVSLRVKSTSSDGANYASRSNSLGFAPQLVVSYDGTTQEPPPAPTNLTASATSGDAPVTLTWTAPLGRVDGYNVKRAQSPGGPYTSIVTVPTTSASDATVMSGQTYYYVVTSVRDGAESSASNQADAVLRPAAPTGVSATAGDGQIALVWSAASGATSYLVERSTQAGGPYATVASPVATGYTDTGLANGTTYFYVVRASNLGGASPASGEVSATPSASGHTVVFTDGFETGNLSNWTTFGGLSVQSTLFHSGTWAAQGTTTNGATYAKKQLPATYTDGSLRAYVYLASYASQVNLLRFRTATDGSLGYLFVNTAGKLSLRNDIGAVTTTSTTTFTTGAWHSLELRVTVNGTSSSSEVWLDGSRIGDLSLTNQNWGVAQIGKIQIGEVQSGRTYNVVFDDVVFDTQLIGP
jgi:fibronectin type 3 domain-containing protein